MEYVAAIKALTTKLAPSMLDGVVKNVKHIITNRLLEYQAEEYNRNFYSKTLLHAAQPVPLTSFYLPLKIVKYNSTLKIDTNSISNIFKNSRYITLVGSAGSGKSTVIKYLVVNAVNEAFAIPIKLELRYLNEYSGSLLDYIKKEIFSLQQLAVEDSIINSMLLRGGFVFYFDGYDELSSLVKARITKDIDEFVKLYSDNYYILTSRPFADSESLPMFHNYNVCELSESEIKEFIYKQIAKEEKEVGDKIIASTVGKHEFNVFLRNPLLLSMYVLTFQSYASVPDERNVFYRQVFETLFSIHDSKSKLAFTREKRSGLNRGQLEEILKLFCFLSYFEERYLFSSTYLNEKLDIIKQKKIELNFNNDNLIYDLQVAVCMLNKEGLDYVFPHRSLQEYFAALYISFLDKDIKAIVYDKIYAWIHASFDVKNKNTHFDFDSIFARSNFLSLLYELDTHDFVVRIALPLLRIIKDGFKETDGRSKFIKKKKLHNSMVMFSWWIVSLKKEMPDIYDSLVEPDIITFPTYSSLKTDKNEEHAVYNILHDFKIYKNKINEIIVRIENKINNSRKSDLDIVNLI